MKRLLLVLGLVAVFSLAASAKKTPATTYNFQFLTVGGDPYCDGMFLKNYGNPQTLVDGFHSDPICEVEQGFGEFNSSGKRFRNPSRVQLSVRRGFGTGDVRERLRTGDVCFTGEFPPFLHHSNSPISNAPAAAVSNMGQASI